MVGLMNGEQNGGVSKRYRGDVIQCMSDAVEAIARSISHNEVVFTNDKAVVPGLRSRCHGSTETGGVHEYWGVDTELVGHAEGWRVHVIVA